MNREEVFDLLWQEQDRAYNLMNLYDSMPHKYGDITLYQAEAYVVNKIGENPDITITEIAQMLNKSKSACSQIVKKLLSKDLVIQKRNDKNRREYNLSLTKNGEKLYLDHINFNKLCQKYTFDLLEKCTLNELKAHLKVQILVNESYKYDIERSIEKYGN